MGRTSSRPGPGQGVPAAAWAAIAGGLVVLVVLASATVPLTGRLRPVLRDVARTLAAGKVPGAPGSRMSGAAVEEDRRAAGIRAVLSSMTQGVRTRNLTTYLSGMDTTRPVVRIRATARFGVLKALPLADPAYSWSGESLDPEPSDAAGSVRVVVDFSYRMAGSDPEAAHIPSVWTFASVGGRWVLSDDGSAASGPTSAADDALPVGPYAEPWELADRSKYVVERRAHVLVVGNSGSRRNVARLATTLERVVGDVRKLWPERTWNGTVVAYAVTDSRFVTEWFGTKAADGKQDDPNGAPSFEARVVSLPGAFRNGAWGQGPTRLIVTPYLLGQNDTYSASVLRHEVTHVATDHVGRYPPAWLLEGAAEYTGFRLGGTRVDAARTFGRHGVPTRTARAMKQGIWRPKLVSDPQTFYEGTSRTVEDAYVDSWVAALYVADRYGDATLRRLYDTACAQPEDASPDAVEATALRTVLRTDHAGFVQAVRSYGLQLRRQFV